ncbi:FAD-dependent monooxygenase [Dactylosporangium sp. NPDC050688]|uniref:FAD-dependent monooxygenase n=1 Tax=Dactylosporangium sp. NPDC050688 TaxID=3157217 RepID=UPI0034104F93
MDSAIVIAGAGPVGLMLGAELRLHGIDVVIFEQRPAPAVESRGIGFTARAAEVFDTRGVLTRFGKIEPGEQGHFGGVRIDFTKLADNHFGVRAVPQYRVERGLEEWATELGARIRRGYSVLGYTEDDEGVTVTVDGPLGRFQHRSRYLVGCDGGRSLIRRLAGIDFPGTAPTRGMYLADIIGADVRPRYIGERVTNGMVMAARLDDGVDRITIHEDIAPPPDGPTPTFEELADTWLKLTGESIHAGRARWISSFTDSARQAAQYRKGRVLLVGDSAHIHLPAGAQGLSVGVQDAVNLGWKLAATVAGWAPPQLLDTYHTERHPVGQRLLRNTRAQGLLYLAATEMDPLRQVLGEIVALPEPARLLAGMVSGLDVRYDVGDDDPLAGLRLADSPVVTADGQPTRVFELLRRGRGVLVVTGADLTPATAAAAWGDRVDVVTGRWGATGADLPAAVLLRPDGHVVWTSRSTQPVQAALGRWFGESAATAVETPAAAEAAQPAAVAVPPQKITTFLAYRHDAEEAMNLYLSAFDDSHVVKVIRAREGEPGWTEGTLQHALFSLGGQQVMCINMPPAGARGHDHANWAELTFNPAMAMYVQCQSEAEIDRLFTALAEGGEVLMPPGTYGFSARFAWVTDRFGVSWRLNLSREPALR